MDHLYKLGVGESNGNVISAKGRHLAAKTTSGPILKDRHLEFRTYATSFRSKSPDDYLN
jgi:hypothetical protein